jgi:tRNA (guanine-N(7)-)-methyltransferase subunit TRM82
MSRLRTPYQCLKQAGDLLVGARGSNIDCFSLQDCSLSSTWRYPPAPESSVGGVGQGASKKLPAESSEPSVDVVRDASLTPPAKRRRLFDGDGPQMPGEKDDKRERKVKNSRSDSVTSGLAAPAIIALAATKGGQHVIAATGEDKSIWVFKKVFREDGTQYLRDMSQRSVRMMGMTQNDEAGI